MTQRAVITKDVSDGSKSTTKPFAELQQQYSTNCKPRKNQFRKKKAAEMVGLIDARSPEVFKLMTANKRSDISPISAESWTEHLQSHFVQPQVSVPDVLPGRSNFPTRHQLLNE
jgi:hypothetical protein